MKKYLQTGTSQESATSFKIQIIEHCFIALWEEKALASPAPLHNHRGGTVNKIIL